MEKGVKNNVTNLMYVLLTYAIAASIVTTKRHSCFAGFCYMVHEMQQFTDTSTNHPVEVSKVDINEAFIDWSLIDLSLV